MARHKCFVSYHSADEGVLQRFKRDFDDTQDAFIFRGQAMPEDLVNSNNDDYVIGEIRRRFLEDSSVTVVLAGRCTWSRKFVDWEIQASLRQPADGSPNGLLAILADPTATEGRLPERVKLNYDSGYCRFYPYPQSDWQLTSWIDDAYNARTSRASLIQNPRARKQYDDPC
jgi:hypothetical protein